VRLGSDMALAAGLPPNFLNFDPQREMLLRPPTGDLKMSWSMYLVYFVAIWRNGLSSRIRILQALLVSPVTKDTRYTVETESS
jgi:hypothetical protein